MTCHNRRALTLRCLDSLRLQADAAELRLFVVDDGSSDGTGGAVRAAWPGAETIAGDGTLYWNGGMRRAWNAAARSRPDFYLWLNDDVVLDPGALARLLGEARDHADGNGAVVIAGSTRQPGTDTASYGGQVRPDPRRPLRFTVVAPGATAQPVETVSGNIVLVSAAVYARLGNLSPCFVHTFGDLDYGLRARAIGIPVLVGSRFFGTCAGPDVSGSSLDPSLGRLGRLLRRLGEERKVHARDWRAFVRRHSGLAPLRWLYTLSPYARIALGAERRA
jgi:GT2 family glycosyltransferase